MDHIGAFLDEEWDSLNKMFSNEDPDVSFLQHLNVNDFLPNQGEIETSSNFFSSNDNVVGVYDDQASGVEFPRDHTFDTMDLKHDDSLLTWPEFTHDDRVLMEELLQFKEQVCDSNQSSHIAKVVPADSFIETQLKRKYETPDSPAEAKCPMKKTRAPRNAPKVGKKIHTRKKTKGIEVSNDEEEKNGTCSSQDDSNASQEPNEGSTSEPNDALNSKVKGKASRRSATDPQSLYARKRRERINERLRILQNLVPNGTKVDLSTMLEEAVEYVKFLQVQIKLLSSDEMWMYAPIAYNGMDMGLYQRMIAPNLQF